MKILLAEDDRYLNKLLSMRLKKWGFEVESVENGQKALDGLKEENGPRLAILDWMMPEIDGVTVIKEIRNRIELNYIYIILLTARDQMSDFVEGMEAGADDFITKPFKDQELRARIRAGQRILELQDDLVIAREAIQYQANHDPLTGRWTRAAIFEILEKEMDRSKRDGNPLSVIMLDIDNFKKVNDKFGHFGGDEALRETAKRIHNSIRSYDSLGRYGGEEFLIILPNCKEKDAIALAERVRETVKATPVIVNGMDVTISCSAGVSTWLAKDSEEIVHLVDRADKALYGAKSSGRDRVVFADADSVIEE